MPSRFQSAVFGSSIVYPNAVVWSEENLVAVACDNIVSIMNPANPVVRGVITIPSRKPFPLGVVDGEGTDLLSGCLLSSVLSCDNRPCVKSISWSPVGLASNAGCLLAVCTTAGRVKLYRFPFCEFLVEWIEVSDISELLYNYYKSSSFGDCQKESSESLDVKPMRGNTGHDSDHHPLVSSVRKNHKRKRQNAAILAEKDSNNSRDTNTLQIVPGKSKEKKTNDPNEPIITLQDYASRNEMMTSCSIAWSPILGVGVATPHENSFYGCSILAVGGKCGRVSFWRVRAPDFYSIDNPMNSSRLSLVGLLKAHDTWVTSIAWALYGSNVSRHQLLLATGSSDGRVKIWHVNGDEVLKSTSVIHYSFPLLKEVMSVDRATISVLSFNVPSQTPWKLFLAIGKGSGSFEVWMIDMLTSKFEKVVCCNAHERIVTGLVWAFDGRCLYSCSQDNSMKSWIFIENSLREVPIPSESPGLNSSSNVPYVFDSCFGLAVSPGNLAIAVARGFKSGSLNPMYQGRSHKAAVEFLWIGGQQLDLSSTTCQDIDNESFSGFRRKELFWWESNILWSLNQYANLNKLPNIWDIVAALLAFKESAPGYLDHILLKWITSFFSSQFNVKFLPKLSSRQLHLINIISRHVVLKEHKEDNVTGKHQEIEGVDINKDDDHVNVWMELLLNSERELLERLVGFCFSALLSLLCDSSTEYLKDGCWSPDGLPQMEEWVSQNGKNVKDSTKFLAAEVGKVKKRSSEDLFGYEMEEQCNFCSSIVPFESTTNAICSGVNYDNGVIQRHKLKRCAITMRVLPTKPSWYCSCCHRQTTKLAPDIFFRMLEYPSDFESLLECLAYKNSSTPCCPFCGILLQRLQPEYSLSAPPV